MNTPAYSVVDVGGSAAEAPVFDATGTLFAFARLAFGPAKTKVGVSEISLETLYAAETSLPVLPARAEPTSGPWRSLTKGRLASYGAGVTELMVRRY